MARITFHHLVGWLKAGIGDLCYRQLLMLSLLSRDDWGIGSQREVDTWVGHQVGLELSQINIEGSIESERSSDGRDDLTNESVQVSVGGSFDVQVSTTNVVNGFVVNHESTVRVLKCGVGSQDGVVGFNDSLRGQTRLTSSH